MSVRIPDHFEEGLGYLVHQLLFSFRQHLLHECAKCGCPVTPEEIAVLVLLQEQDGMRQTDLAEKLAKDKAVITRTLNSLDRKGYVERHHDSRDRRIVRACLTRAGRSLNRRLRPVIKDLLGEALQGISQSDYDRTRSVLRHIIENLR